MLQMLGSSISSFNMKFVQTLGDKSKVTGAFYQYIKPMNDGIFWILSHLYNPNIVVENDIVEATRSWHFSALASSKDKVDLSSFKMTQLSYFLRLCDMLLFPYMTGGEMSSVAGRLNVQMLQSFCEHGTLKAMVDYSVLFVRAFLQAADMKFNYTEESTTISNYGGFDWEKLIADMSHSSVEQKVLSDCRYNFSVHGFCYLFEIWKIIIST